MAAKRFKSKIDRWIFVLLVVVIVVQIVAVGSAALQAGEPLLTTGLIFLLIAVVGLMVDGQPKAGFGTPSRKLEFFSDTLAMWGWSEKENVIPWSVRSHVHPDNIDREKGEMILLPNFRLPTLIHTRSANAKWL